MPDAVIVCPYCNSRLDRRSSACPRCDARLPADLTASLPETAVTETAPPPNFAPGKRKTIAAILGIMLTMAAITAGYVLWTKEFRRENDHKKGFAPIDLVAKSPLEMQTVNFLPARCNAVAAVNLAGVRENPLIKKALLEKPAKSVNFLIDQLKDARINLDNVDQVAVGLDLADIPPKIYVIVQTREPYDRDAVVKAFAPHKATVLGDGPVVQFPLSQMGFGSAWCFAPNHLAFVFCLVPDENDLKAIPKLPREKFAGSSPKLRSLIESLDKNSTLWLAADLEKKDGLDALLAFADTRAYKEFLDAKTLTLAVKPDGDDLRVFAELLADSPKSAAAVEKKLQAFDGRGEKSKTVAVDPAQPRVTLELRYDPSAIAEILSKGPAFKK